MATEEYKIRLSAMNMLARREQSRAELESKLGARFDKEIISQVLDTLIREGLQSDDRFVEAFVSSRVRRGQGPVKIAYDLRNKGIQSDAISEELEKYSSEWFELARELMSRKFGDMPPEDFKEKQKRQRFVAGRGFTNDICYRLF